MENSLPKNWVETELKTISNIVRGITYKKDQASSGEFNESFYILRGGNIQDGKIDFNTNDNVYVTSSLIQEIQKIQKFDVVIVGSTGSKKLIGKAGIAEENLENVSFGAFLMLMRTDSINKKFHSYFFKSHYYRTSISNLAGGVNINNIRKEHLENLTFPLPPLSEQKRIVVKLDALFAQQEVMKNALAKIPTLLKDFRQQVLTQAVTGKLTESWREGRELEEWKEVELGEVCNLKAGKFVAASEISNEKLDGYYPCYGANGFRGYVKSFTHIGKYSLIGRQGALCGNVHLIDEQFHATEHALVVTPIANIDDIWMFYKLTSLELINYAKGVAQPGLSVMNLNPILINTPPFEEQQEIVSRVESLFAKADAIEKRYKNLKAKIDTLPQALLHKAFKGELVAQLPTDGDAKDLLKEIMALKKESNVKKKVVKKYKQNEEVLGNVAEGEIKYKR